MTDVAGETGVKEDKKLGMADAADVHRSGQRQGGPTVLLQQSTAEFPLKIMEKHNNQPFILLSLELSTIEMED